MKNRKTKKTKKIMKTISYKLNKIARKLYKGRDVSHGILHVSRVRNNARMISEKMQITDVNTLIKIEAAALFHDLWDHKYINHEANEYTNIKKKFNEELKKNYFSDHDIKEIEIIIDNISLSREINLRKENKSFNLKHLQLMRDIVSDADKLEMLGFDGINRIIEYQMHKYPYTKSDELKFIVKDVYNNKISRLIDDKYIRTNVGIELAKPLMQEMDNYIKLI